jgi:uncharacterized protein (DUF305 family)
MFGQIPIRNAFALFAWAVLLACSSDTRDAGNDSAAGTVTDSADIDDPDRVDPEAAAAGPLLQTLADREEALLEMARIAVNRREQVEVSVDARRMLTEQRRESNRLLGALKSEYRITYRPTIPQAELDLIGNVQGAGVGEFDRIFLDAVVKHHEGDIGIIDEALPKITKPQVREMLTAIRAQRATEAAAFKKQLEAAQSRR